MPVSRTLVVTFIVWLLAVPASAADAFQHACLTKAEQRAAVAAGKAQPLAEVIKTLHAHGRRAELVRARLCRRGEGLVYVLTLLSHSGKVTRVAVDAATLPASRL